MIRTYTDERPSTNNIKKEQPTNDSCVISQNQDQENENAEAVVRRCSS